MAATVDERSVLVPAPDMVWREVGGEMVLLDPNQNKIMGLNGTGGEVWNALDGTRTLAEVASLLAARFDKDADESKALARQLDQGLGEDLLQQYLSGLQESLGYSIDRQIWDQIRGSS